MPRECGWCSARELSTWESRIAEGESIAIVSIDTPFSSSAAWRHVRLHMQPRLRGEMASSAATVTLSDFAERLLDLTQQAAMVGEYAHVTNNGKLALQSIQQQRELLVTLMSRLGIESGEAAELYSDTKKVMRAIGRVLESGEHVEAGQALVAALISENGDHLVTGIERAIQFGRARAASLLEEGVEA